jgi:hypothetical protein
MVYMFCYCYYGMISYKQPAAAFGGSSGACARGIQGQRRSREVSEVRQLLASQVLMCCGYAACLHRKLQGA